MVAVPAVGVTRLRIMRSVVVFPAPFGPRNPVTRPGCTVNDRLSTALTRLYCLVRPETTICPSDIGLPPCGRPVRVHAPAAPRLAIMAHQVNRGGPPGRSRPA